MLLREGAGMKKESEVYSHNLTQGIVGTSLGCASDITQKRQSPLDQSLQHFDACLERATKLASLLNSAADRLAGVVPEEPNGCGKELGLSGVAYEVGFRTARLVEILDSIERATQRLNDI
jgi:hypothetical protein